MKKLLALGLMLLLPLQNVFANEQESGIIDKINSIDNIESTETSTRINYLVIDNDTIATSGRSWVQPSGFPIFRAHVTNTQNQRLTVTVTTSSGFREAFTVAANSTGTINGRNIPAGTTRIDFSTPNGIVTGNLSVRVSDIPL